jgi:hypothetical protein
MQARSSCAARIARNRDHLPDHRPGKAPVSVGHVRVGVCGGKK